MESVLENNAAQSAVPSFTEPLPDLVAQHLAKLQDIATKCDRENQLELIACTPVTLQEEGNLICAYDFEQEKCKGFEWDFAPNEIFDSTAKAQAKLNKVQAEEEKTHANVLSFCAKLKALSEQDKAGFVQDIKKGKFERTIAQFGYGVRVCCPSCRGKGIQKCPDCKGTGLIKCPDCNGRGKITKTRLETYTKQTYSNVQNKVLKRNYSHQEQYKVDCEQCHGSGKIKCGTCNGDGLIKCRSCSGDGLVEKSILLKLKAKLRLEIVEANQSDDLAFVPQIGSTERYSLSRATPINLLATSLLKISQLSAIGYDFNELQKVLTIAGLAKVRDLAQLKFNGEGHFYQDQYRIPYNKSADVWLVEYHYSDKKFVDILMADDGTVVQAAPFVDAVFAPYVALLEEAAASKFADVTTLIDKLKSSDLIGACLQAKLNHRVNETSSILEQGAEERLSVALRKKIGQLFNDWQEQDDLRQAQDELQQEQYEQRMRFRRNLKIGAAALLVIAAAGTFAWLKLSGQL